MKRILVDGAFGQIGVELVRRLREVYGASGVLATSIRDKGIDLGDGPFALLDVRDPSRMAELVQRHRADTIIHLAGILSARAEEQPQPAWDVNVNGLKVALEVARREDCSLFFPSSIAAFGGATPKRRTPQDTIQRPSTIYGIAKLTGELLCDYYHSRYGVDTRGVRFPGLISCVTPPGGGTTDYAVWIFYEALQRGRYSSFIAPGTSMDMMYMPDALDSVIQLMEADPSGLVHRNAFNVTAMSFAPEELAAAIRRRLPEFVMDYDVDPARQAIADSWPDSLDDSAAREEWGWNPRYDLEAMTDDMLRRLSAKLDIPIDGNPQGGA
ncbi:MAG: NAD-dependent epimerase/dehydratase family protein [Synergistales bacterium]|nr:NAD-dependent epimerase/dehydratase family protein [Synergistales bacterium]